MKYPLSTRDAKKLKSVLSSEGKKLLYFHEDCDGICSAALILKVFKNFSPKPREGPKMELDFIRGIIEKKPDVLVFLDLPVDQEWENMLYIKKELHDCEIIVIDHHIPERDLNHDGIIHINPKFHKECYIPTACMIYNMYKSMELGKHELKRLIWISCIGIIGDYGFEDCGDILEECRKSLKGSIDDDPRKSKLGTCSELISAAITLYGAKGAKTVLNSFLKTDSYTDCLKNKDLQDFQKSVKEEFDRVLDDFNKKKEIHKKANLIAYEIESELNLTSALSSAISEENPDKIILIRKKTKKGYKVSARFQKGKRDMGTLFKKCVKGLGSGGGHIRAAGAIVKDYKEFEKRILKELEKRSK